MPRFHGHRRERQLSAIQLTEREEATASERLRALGLAPQRHHQLPRRRSIGPAHVAFTHPPIPTRPYQGAGHA